MLHHRKALLKDGLRRVFGTEQPRLLRDRGGVDVRQNLRSIRKVALITQRPAGQPLHHQDAVREKLPAVIAEQRSRRPAARLQRLQGGKFVGDLVLQVHLAAGIDAQHQPLAAHRVNKQVVEVILSLPQNGEGQLRSLLQPQLAKETPTVRQLPKCFCLNQTSIPP